MTPDDKPILPGRCRQRTGYVSAKPVDDRAGAVGRVVVDDDDLAVEPMRA